MSEKCKEICGSDKADMYVPFFDVQNTMMHYNWANRRMLIALITVCLTFIITIVVFVVGYTIREKNWLNTIINMQTPAVTEVQDGTQQR